MSEKNIICIESSLSIKEVIEIFIEEEEKKHVIEFKEDKKQDTSEESILLFDNYMNQPLPETLLSNTCDIVVRVTNFNHWKEVSHSTVLDKLCLMFQKGVTTVFK